MIGTSYCDAPKYFRSNCLTNCKTVQVVLTGMLIHTLHATFKDPVEAINGVRMHLETLTIQILTCAVVHPAIGGKRFANTKDMLRMDFVSHDKGTSSRLDSSALNTACQFDKTSSREFELAMVRPTIFRPVTRRFNGNWPLN